MTSRIVPLLLATIFLSSVPAAQAQQPGNMPRIGFVQRRLPPTPTNPDPLAEALRQGLKDFGYIDGRNIQIEHRFGKGREERLPALIAELVQLKVDVMIVSGFPAVRAAKQATQSIPIVMVTTADPVASGLVNSLARPGENITGVTRLTRELSGKRLELLKEGVPSLSRVGLLTVLQNRPEYESVARGLKLTIVPMEISGPKPDLEGAIQTAARAGVNGLVTIRDAVTASYMKQIADLAIKTGLPSMNEDSLYVEAGGLMSYATNDAAQFRRAAYYVDRILKGTKPADLPVEQPMKFEFVVNLKTAKQIGLTIPPNVLVRADRVIR